MAPSITLHSYYELSVKGLRSHVASFSGDILAVKLDYTAFRRLRRVDFPWRMACVHFGGYYYGL